MQLLERHGVLTREAVLAKGAPGGFAGVYAVLRALEESGKVRRGYFVDGLGAAQFALPGAVERIRDLREASAEASVLALPAADPAQPYGAALPWPQGTGGSGDPRGRGAYVVLASGEPAAFLERGARTLLTFAAGGDGGWIDALASLVKDGRLRRIELSRIDGEPAPGRVRRGSAHGRVRGRLPGARPAGLVAHVPDALRSDRDRATIPSR
jgi:ATP-dependent Lhr-like helicase